MLAPTLLVSARAQVSQVVCKPFSILKLFPGVVHRGIANEEAFDRILFFISTNTEWCVCVHPPQASPLPSCCLHVAPTPHLIPSPRHPSSNRALCYPLHSPLWHLHCAFVSLRVPRTLRFCFALRCHCPPPLLLLLLCVALPFDVTAPPPPSSSFVLHCPSMSLPPSFVLH
jgi:hypothetical protein